MWPQRYINAPILRDENTETDELFDDRRIFYLGDANSNVTTLVDTGGDAVERYVYAPYGVLTICDATCSNTRGASSYANGYAYTGRQLDVETGLYYYRHRIYHSQLGRFCSRDPVGYEGGLSNYGFADASPTNFSDPHGLQSLTPGENLGYALMWHWVFGFGRTFTGHADGLQSQRNIRNAVRNTLLKMQSQLCREGKRQSGRDVVTLRGNIIQPNEFILIQTTNVPSEGLIMDIQYLVEFSECCCTVDYNVAYRWLDLADIHPARHPLPDGLMYWFPHLLGLQPGTEFWIDIRWKAKHTRILPLSADAVRAGCQPFESGWPSTTGE